MVTLLARQLSFAYTSGPPAVADVDLAVRPGELCCVIGPNGSGKSTLVRLLAGLRRPDRGSVLYDGRPLAELSPRERARRVAVVPQTLRAIPETSVRAFVSGGRYGRLDVWRRSGPGDVLAVETSLEAADVADLGERLLTELSGGQLQRVLIARALAQEAGALLVDEPTASLDPEHQLAVFELVARLCAQGRAVLAVTHDLNLASQFATEVVLLEAGRRVAAGRPEEVLRPEVLRPVYGNRLWFGQGPDRAGGAPRPFVLPWAGVD